MANTWGIKRADRGYLAVGSGVGGLVIPVQNGARMNYPPRYRDVQGTSNNVYDVSYFRGIAYPTFNGPVDVTSDWFTATNINAWLIARGAAAGVGFDDLAEMAGPVAYSDGNIVQTLVQPKGNLLTLGARQDEQLRCTLGIVGTDKTTAAFAAAGIAPNVLQRASFADVVFLSGVHGVTEFTFSLNNNTRPNPIIGEGAGSGVVEMNAGKPVITLDVTVDATGTYPVNEGSYSFSVKPPGAAAAVVFSCARMRIDNPDDIGKQEERAGQRFLLTNISTDGVAFPITVA